MLKKRPVMISIRLEEKNSELNAETKLKKLRKEKKMHKSILY